MAKIRSRIRIVVFSITGIIVAFLVFRIIVDIAQAPVSSVIVQLIDAITNPLIAPFYGIARSPAIALIGLNIDAIIAIVGYIVSSIIFTEIVTSFIEENAETILQNLIDGIFKLVEFVLLIRIIFEIFAIFQTSQSPAFVQIIYGLTNWSQGILPKFSLGTGFIDLSAILCLVITAVLDAITDSILNAIFDRIEKEEEKKKEVKQVSSQSPVVNNTIQHQPQAPAPTQSVVVNIPQQPAPTVTKEVHIHHMQPVIMPVTNPAMPTSDNGANGKPKAIEGEIKND